MKYPNQMNVFFFMQDFFKEENWATSIFIII